MSYGATASRSLTQEERRLARLALDLGATAHANPLSDAERLLVDVALSTPASRPEELAYAALSIQGGGDPLGTSLCQIRPVAQRRRQGRFYTPADLVGPMVAWVLGQDPARIIDAGCGSGRFAVAVARLRPDLPVLAVDLDPLATLLARATAHVLGARAVGVLNADYTKLALPAISGRTAFIGNPPYVRHHDLGPEAKGWARDAARRLGLRLSTLAGLHVYFFLATALYAKPGDVGCFVTSAEWLDVNYGSALRALFLDGLGGQALHLIDPRAVPFDDAMTTAVIACFEVGAEPQRLRLRLVANPAQLDALGNGRAVDADALREADRWTTVFSEDRHTADHGMIPLKSIARVHRGLVTGANAYFILTRQRAAELGLTRWCRPAITMAEEVLEADGIVRNGPERRLLLDVPADIDRSTYPELDDYLLQGEVPRGDDPAVCGGYITTHRRPWWYLGQWRPAPIVASYMARQAPRFALNPDGLALINVIHGIYPYREMGQGEFEALVRALNDGRDSFRGRGRTYHGGLEKFEPREMEALLIPAGALGRAP